MCDVDVTVCFLEDKLCCMLFVSLWVGNCWWDVGGNVKYSIYGAVRFTFSHTFTITGHCSLCVPVCSVTNCKDCSTDTAKCDVCRDGYGANADQTACEG